MSDSNKQICQLCLDKAPASECETIDEIKKAMLEFLLININFDISDCAVACNMCLSRLQESFDFKSRCNTSFIEADNKADVVKVFPREMMSNEANIGNKYYQSSQVCRFCMSALRNEWDINYITNLNDGVLFKEMIEYCFPEMGLSDVHESAICKPCLNSLKGFHEFLKSCREVERLCQLVIPGTADIPILKELLKSKDLEELDKPIIIKKECSDAENFVTPVPCLENVDIPSIKCEELDIKDESDTGPSSSKDKMFVCPHCDLQSKRRGNINRHISVIHERKNSRLHSTCKSSHRRDLNKRITHHGKESPYKCPGCEKKYTEKSTLDNHLLKNHDNFSHLVTSKIHHCQFCTYKSILAQDLIRHVAHNHDRINAEKFPCDHCDYFALQKTHLKRHLLVHTNLRPHQCTACKKGFNQKLHLDSHILNNHKANADLLKTVTSKIHRCTMCKYETILKTDLCRHIKSIHK